MNMPGHNSKEGLKSYLERLTNLANEIDGLKGDMKDIFTEAKENGFDPKALRVLLKRATEDEGKYKARIALEETVEEYSRALGDLASTPLGKAALERVAQ